MIGIPDEGPRPSTRSDGLKPTKAPRTRIEDISAIGERLSEEQLRLVVGGMMMASCPDTIDPGDGGVGDHIC